MQLFSTICAVAMLSIIFLVVGGVATWALVLGWRHREWSAIACGLFFWFVVVCLADAMVFPWLMR